MVATRTRSSALAALTETVAQNDGFISGLKVQQRDGESMEVALDVEVTDLRHLERIMAALRAPAENLRVERTRG
jgi:GTP pyrophosphokinase